MRLKATVYFTVEDDPLKNGRFVVDGDGLRVSDAVDDTLRSLLCMPKRADQVAEATRWGVEQAQREAAEAIKARDGWQQSYFEADRKRVSAERLAGECQAEVAALAVDIERLSGENSKLKKEIEFLTSEPPIKKKARKK